MVQMVKNLPVMQGSVCGLGRSAGVVTPVFLPGGFHGQEDPVHRVAKSWTQLNDYHFHFHWHSRMKVGEEKKRSGFSIYRSSLHPNKSIISWKKNSFNNSSTDHPNLPEPTLHVLRTLTLA